MVFTWWRCLGLTSWLATAALLFGSLPLAAQTVSAASPEQPMAANAPGTNAAMTRTRFVIGLDRATHFQVFSLRDPNRVIVELPDVRLQLPPQTEGGPSGLVKAFRGGLSAPGQSRVVIDVTVPVIVESAKIEKDPGGKGHRLALEIVPVDQEPPARKVFRQPFALGAAGMVQPPMPKPAVRPAIRAARAKPHKPVIVIDPGHGGDDTGAMKEGTVEKEVVLLFGKALKAKLEASGLYKVLMTRDTDVFIPLDERRAIAERNGAALFIAVHADYAKTDARGATIYSLRESVGKALKHSATSAAAANNLSKGSLVVQANGDKETVKGFLTDLAEREVERTQEGTHVFSRSVIEHMATSTSLRNDPDKEASFRVLKTAQFPSVLIELAYVTNKEDAELLKSDAWRDKVSNAIVTAVGNYFSHQVARLPL